MSEAYFIADTHLGHEGILTHTKRPFTNIVDHDNYILDKINGRVGKYDRLYILGDFAWNNHVAYRKRIVCENVWLIEGNHDKMNLEAKTAFIKVEQVKVVNANRYKFFCSHYAHFRWPGSSDTIMLYGHSHGNAESFLNLVMPKRLSMDVGVDVAKEVLGDFVPFSVQEIVDHVYRKRTLKQRFVGWVLNKIK